LSVLLFQVLLPFRSFIHKAKFASRINQIFINPFSHDRAPHSVKIKILISTLAFFASATTLRESSAVPIQKRYPKTCGIIGFDKAPAYSHSSTKKTATFKDCLKACDADASCLSFSTGGPTHTECNLYNLPLIQLANPMDIYNDYTFYDRECTVEISNQVGTTGGAGPWQICDVAAFDLDSPAYHVDSTPANADYPHCNAQCQADPNCQSFAFGNSQCLLYIVGAFMNINRQPESPYIFYDRNCPGAVVAPPSVESTLIIV
jgi:hypothetical protein